jgi:hypothetical protein
LPGSSRIATDAIARPVALGHASHRQRGVIGKQQEQKDAGQADRGHPHHAVDRRGDDRQLMRSAA